jgi:hypothetical protein
VKKVGKAWRAREDLVFVYDGESKQRNMGRRIRVETAANKERK